MTNFWSFFSLLYSFQVRSGLFFLTEWTTSFRPSLLMFMMQSLILIRLMFDITEISAVVAAAGGLVGVVYYFLDIRNHARTSGAFQYYASIRLLFAFPTTMCKEVTLRGNTFATFQRGLFCFISVNMFCFDVFRFPRKRNSSSLMKGHRTA